MEESMKVSKIFNYAKYFKFYDGENINGLSSSHWDKPAQILNDTRNIVYKKKYYNFKDTKKIMDGFKKL